MQTGPVEIQQPELVLNVANRVKLPLPIACALPQQETQGRDPKTGRPIAGRNVFGHDRVDTGGFYTKGAEVTEQDYGRYRIARRAGKIKPQGVGWLQLTWWEFQDRADGLGGCWKTEFNLLVGYSIFKSYLDKMTFYKAATKYNGKQIYADQITPKYDAWAKHLSTFQPHQKIILLGG